MRASGSIIASVHGGFPPWLNVLVLVAAIAFVLFRRIRGEPLLAKRVLLLPVILTIVGTVNHTQNLRTLGDGDGDGDIDGGGSDRIGEGIVAHGVGTCHPLCAEALTRRRFPSGSTRWTSQPQGCSTISTPNSTAMGSISRTRK